MANDIAKHPIPEMFTYMGVEKITPKDKFTIEYAEGFLTATINRHNGSVEVIRRHMKGGFTEATSFDPKKMGKIARDDVIIRLRNDGFSQSEITRRIGSFNGAKTPVRWLGSKRTCPCVPSAKRTFSANGGSVWTSTTSHSMMRTSYSKGSIGFGCCFAWHKAQSSKSSC